MTETNQTPNKIQERLNLLISKERRWFDDDHNKIVFFARTVPILILGDHSDNLEEESVLDKVVKKLKEKYHLAIPLKGVSKNGNHIHCERRAIKHYPVVIKLESDKISKPGTIGENVLIACDRECQEKTFLFVNKKPEIVTQVFLIDHYYLYFPWTYFCKDDSDMVNKATQIAIRECHRIAYLSANKLQD